MANKVPTNPEPTTAMRFGVCMMQDKLGDKNRHLSGHKHEVCTMIPFKTQIGVKTIMELPHFNITSLIFAPENLTQFRGSDHFFSQGLIHFLLIY
jgi:hypothetical protein